MATDTTLWCGHDLEDDETTETVVRVAGNVRAGRRIVSDFLICLDCWCDHDEGARGSFQLSDDGDRTKIVVYHLYPHSEPTEARPCEGCGVIVIRGRDPRMKHHTCSRPCSARASRRSTADVTATATHSCVGCGAEMAGRADRRYCSSRCRQKAYRRRVNPELQAKEAAAWEPMSVLLSRNGIEVPTD